jgi:phosphoribosylanthranilate isomerase
MLIAGKLAGAKVFTWLFVQWARASHAECGTASTKAPHRPNAHGEMTTKVKICGLGTEAALAAALEGGADYVGLVFFPPSPRNVTPAAAKALAGAARSRAKIVALAVDPDDALIDTIVASAAPDLLQLHGEETPERVAEIRRRWGVPVMKAIKVEAAADARAALRYREAADLILFDARAPAEATRPGGNGAPFDWRALLGVKDEVAFMLSGGLTPDNVAEAIRLTGATIVDVSSGVEASPGEKDPELIRRFLRAAKGV